MDEIKEIKLRVEIKIRGTEKEIRRERAKIAALSTAEEVVSMHIEQLGVKEKPFEKTMKMLEEDERLNDSLQFHFH